MGACYGKQARQAGAVEVKNSDDLNVHVRSPAGKAAAGTTDEEIVHHLTEHIIGHVVHGSTSGKDTATPLFSPRAPAPAYKQLCACIATESEGGGLPQPAVDPRAAQVVHELVSSIIKNVVSAAAEKPADVDAVTISVPAPAAVTPTPAETTTLAELPTTAASTPTSTSAPTPVIISAATTPTASTTPTAFTPPSAIPSSIPSAPAPTPAPTPGAAPAVQPAHPPRAPLHTTAGPRIHHPHNRSTPSSVPTSSAAAPTPAPSAIPAHRTSSGSDQSQSSDKAGAANTNKKAPGGQKTGAKKNKNRRRK